MEDPKRLAYLFYRYYEKKCTPSEKDELFGLLQDPANDGALRQLIDETWSHHLPIHQQSPESADRILEYITRHQPPVAVLQTADHEYPESNKSGVHPGGRPAIIGNMRGHRYVFVKYAAAILVVTGLAYFLYYRNTRGRAAEPQVAGIASSVAGDQCLTLSDGSKVLLHKNAHIDYKPFSGNTREVTLTGEAYFDIRRDERPFIVHTASVTTTVLGTAFNIDAHEKDFVITVVKGKVKVENGAGDYSILKRNEQATLDVIHNRITKTQVDAGEIITWKKPYLLFNDVSMKEAIAELDQRFHASIVLTTPALENCHVSASFTQGEPLEQIIKVLSKINNMEYRQAASGSYELSGEGCK